MKKGFLKIIGFTILISVFVLASSLSSQADNDVLDGIYKVRNNYSDQYVTSGGTYYLRSQATYESSTPMYIVQHSQNNFGDLTNTLYNYWRITHLGNGEHVIRSVADETKALSLSGTNVTLVTVGSTVPDSARWYISGGNIKPKSDTSKCIILSPPTPSSTIYSDGVYYNYFNLKVNSIGDMAFEKWSFVSESPSGVVIRDDNIGTLIKSITVTVNPSTTAFSLESLNYSVLSFINGNAATITWSSLNNTVATVNQGSITPVSTGTTTIQGSINVSSSNPNKNININLNVVDHDIGITNNTKYYIMSSTSGRYLSLQSGSDVDGIGIYSVIRNTGNYSKWTVQAQSDSKYQFINNIGSASRVMTASGTNLCIYTDSNASTQKFEIHRINEKGDTQGLYYIKYGSYYLKENSNYNVTLTTSISNATAWSFMAVEKKMQICIALVMTVLIPH